MRPSESMLENTAQTLENYITPFSRGVDCIGRGVLALMVLLITLDVVLRYFFNSPIKGSYELIESMMVLIVFLGLGYVQVNQSNISINLITNKLSPAKSSVLRSATNFLCLVIMVLITWRCSLQALTTKANGTMSDVLFIPSYIFIWVVVFGSALLSAIFLIDFIKSFDGIFKKCKRPWLWISLSGLFVLLLLTIPVWLQWLSLDISRPFFGLIAIGLLVLLLFSNMPIGPVMALVGFLGFSYLVNSDASLTILGTAPLRSAASHSMSTIPLFVLMGHLCFHSGLSQDIYTTMRNWLGRLPGGLAMSTVGGCAGFAAVSGSSMATAITMGTVALPEMKKYKYDDGLSCGCVAAGGSIGILIPPSVPFIIYATLTEESIGKLFMAGIIPGLLQATLYILTIFLLCKMKPHLGPLGPSSSWKEKIVSIKNIWGISLLFFIVIGGIYGGIFDPTEAAGVGAFGALVLGFIKKKLTKEKLLICLADAVKNTAMLLLLVIGADIFSYFLTITQIPFILSDFVVGLPIPNAGMIWAILLVYIVLGCILPIIPTIILTIPIFLPVVTGLGYDPIWFGVLVVTMAEVGQITPPVGINVFAIAGVAKDVPLIKIFKGIIPFLVADFFRLFLLFFIPALSLWLPGIMK